MKKKILIISLIVVIIFSFFFTFIASDTIRIGKGFGRETKLVINTQRGDDFLEYLDNLEKEGVEIDIDIITNYEYVVTLSSLDNLQIIKDEILNAIPDVTFKEEGSFGVVANYINNQGFVKTYLMLLIFSIIFYLVLRYRMVGFLYSIQVFTSYALAMYAVVVNGSLFTETFWSSLSVTLLISLVSFHSFVLENRTKTLHEVMETPKLIINDALKIWLINSIFSYVLIVSTLLDGMGSGLFVLVYSAIQFIVSIIFVKVFSLTTDSQDANIMNARIADRWQLDFDFKSSKIYSRLSLFIILAASITLITIQSPSLSKTQASDYEKQSVLIVSDSNASIYLEVQAMLNSIGIFNNQLSYSTSDQGELWIYFNRLVSESDLRIARNVISDHLGIETRSYVTRDKPLPTQQGEFYGSIFILLLITFVVLISYSYDMTPFKVVFMAMLSITVLGIVLLGNLGTWKSEFIVLFYSIPLVLAHHYSTSSRLISLKSQTLSVEDTVSFLPLIVGVLLFAACIIIIIPIEIGLTLAKNLAILSIVIEVSRRITLFILGLIRKDVDEYDDDTFGNL